MSDPERMQRLHGAFTRSHVYTEQAGNKLLKLILDKESPFPIYHDTAGLFASVMPIFALAEEAANAAIVAMAEVESLRAKLAAVRQWQQSWSDSEDHLLLLPEASAELVAILRSQEPPTGQEQP